MSPPETPVPPCRGARLPAPTRSAHRGPRGSGRHQQSCSGPNAGGDSLALPSVGRTTPASHHGHPCRALGAPGPASPGRPGRPAPPCPPVLGPACWKHRRGGADTPAPTGSTLRASRAPDRGGRGQWPGTAAPLGPASLPLLSSTPAASPVLWGHRGPPWPPRWRGSLGPARPPAVLLWPRWLPACKRRAGRWSARP